MLNEKEREVLQSIIDYIDENGYPPAVREIGKKVGFKSSGTIHRYFNSLQEKGYIEKKEGMPRALRVLKKI